MDRAPLRKRRVEMNFRVSESRFDVEAALRRQLAR